MRKAVLFCPSRVWGGIEKNVRLRAQFLGASGVKVYVVLLRSVFVEQFLGLTNVEVIEVDSRGGDVNLCVIANYVRFLKKIKPDVVFAALKKDWWLVSFASKLAGVERVILYLGIARKIKSPVKYLVVFRCFKAILMVNSDSLRQKMLKYSWYFNGKNVVRVYNGFELPSLSGEAADFRALFDLSPNAVIIGCAGRFSPQKGFDLLPDIVARLPRHIHVVHAGEGEHEHEIKANVNARPESERIHFVGYQNDMYRFLRGIDVFLLCSRNEGMANVLNEAMSLGKPVVSTRVPGSDELLANGRYGLLVPIDDVDAMAQGVISLVDGTVSLDPVSIIKRIHDEFGLQRMIRETNRLFFGADPAK